MWAVPQNCDLLCKRNNAVKVCLKPEYPQRTSLEYILSISWSTQIFGMNVRWDTTDLLSAINSAELTSLTNDNNSVTYADRR